MHPTLRAASRRPISTAPAHATKGMARSARDDCTTTTQL
jgi:hypothetical protein